MSDSSPIFAFQNQGKPTEYGFVPVRSANALPQADWREVVGWEVSLDAAIRSQIDEKVREKIRIQGFHVIDFLNSL